MYREKTKDEIQAWKDSLDDNSPASFNLITSKTDDFLYTTQYWSTVGVAGRNFQAETGIRSICNGEVNDDFYLIQHGNPLYKEAHDKIVELNEKGASEDKINSSVEFDIFRPNPLKKGTADDR